MDKRWEIFFMIIVFAAFACVAYHLARKFGEKSVKTNIMKGVAVGAAATLLRSFLIPNVPGLSWFYMLMVLAFIVGICYQFYREGNELNEFVASAILISLSGLIGCSAAANYETTFPLLVAIIAPIIAVTFCAVSVLSFNRGRADDEDKPKYTRWMACAVAIALVALVGTSVFAFSITGDNSSDNQNKADGLKIPDTVSAENGAGADARFVQKWTENEKNRIDSDFAAKLAKKAEANNGVITAEMSEEVLLENSGHDARQLAIFANAFGLHDDPNDYESLYTKKGGKPDYLSEEGISLYNKLEGYLSAVTEKREKAPESGTNTGYSDDTYVVSSEAGITGDRSATKFVSPDENVEPFWLMDRCSNLVYNKPPKSVPEGPTDQPTPTPPNKNMKDQSKIPKKNTEPNDDKGPGPNTNNPSNPNKSKKDTSDSSTSGSYKDYTDNQKNLQDTNQNQKTGSDSSKPSTSAPKPNTNVDNNGDKGNGGAPINTPTPKKEPETVKGDPPAGHMEEPS